MRQLKAFMGLQINICWQMITKGSKHDSILAPTDRVLGESRLYLVEQAAYLSNVARVNAPCSTGSDPPGRNHGRQHK